MARENLENLEPLGDIRDKVNNNFTELYSATNTQGQQILNNLETFGVIRGKINSNFTQLYNETFSLIAENEQLMDENTELTNTNNSLTEENRQLTTDKEELATKNTELTTTNNSLTATINDDNEDFDNIYTAIVSKNPEIEPVKDDRNTYAPSIESIKQDGGQPEDFSINYCYYLFGVSTSKASDNRIKNIQNLLKYCKDVSNWNNAFYGCPLPDGYVLDVNMVAGNPTFDNTKCNIFNEVYGADTNSEITLKATTNGIVSSIFKGVNNSNYQGLINTVINDLGNNIVDDLDDLYYNALNIKSIELNVDLKNLTSLINTFKGFNTKDKAGIIKELNLEDLGIKCELLNWMTSCFEGSGLTAINLGNTTLKNCNKESTFDYCTKLLTMHINIKDEAIDNFGANERNNTCYEMFYNCNNLTQVTSDEPLDIIGVPYRMFSSCSKLRSVPVINIHMAQYSWSELTNFDCGGMFYSCRLIENIELNFIEPEIAITRGVTLYESFRGCTNLKVLTGTNLFAYVKNLNSTFTGCINLQRLEITGEICKFSSVATITLDLSVSPVFDATDFINRLSPNTSTKTRIIKLNATVLNSLTDETKALAEKKLYTLQ